MRLLKFVFIWIPLSIVASFLSIMALGIYMGDAIPKNPSGYAMVFMLASSIIFGLIGSSIGRALRNFSLPDAVYTNGGMSTLIKTKLFWMIGPQLIGLQIGSIIGLFAGLIAGQHFYPA